MMFGVMAVSSHPATTTACVVGGWCVYVASGERDRERAEPPSQVLSSIDCLELQSGASWVSRECADETQLKQKIETENKGSKTKYQKRVRMMKCMQLWASGSVHQRVPRRSSLADRRPHTDPRQHTCERVHLHPHPLSEYSF